MYKYDEKRKFYQKKKKAKSIPITHIPERLRKVDKMMNEMIKKRIKENEKLSNKKNKMNQTKQSRRNNNNNNNKGKKEM